MPTRTSEKSRLDHRAGSGAPPYKTRLASRHQKISYPDGISRQVRSFIHEILINVPPNPTGEIACAARGRRHHETARTVAEHCHAWNNGVPRRLRRQFEQLNGHA